MRCMGLRLGAELSTTRVSLTARMERVQSDTAIVPEMFFADGIATRESDMVTVPFSN
jgi:hypothetical protein